MTLNISFFMIQHSYKEMLNFLSHLSISFFMIQHSYKEMLNFLSHLSISFFMIYKENFNLYMLF